MVGMGVVGLGVVGMGVVGMGVVYVVGCFSGFL